MSLQKWISKEIIAAIITGICGIVVAIIYSYSKGCSCKPPPPSSGSFQNFEPRNGTPGSGDLKTYCRDVWFASCEFESTEVRAHEGTRAIRVKVEGHSNPKDKGGTVRIFFSSEKAVDLSSASTLSAWVYDTQGNNTVELKLCNGDYCPIKENIWSAMESVKNKWSKITWLIPKLNLIDITKITAIEIYEWNEGTYYFDDIRWQ